MTLVLKPRKLVRIRCLPTVSAPAMPLFQCTKDQPTAERMKKRRGEGGVGSNTGQGYGLTPKEVEELAVRTAQMVSIHDVRIRVLSTMFSKVRFPVDSEYGKKLMKVDAEWKARRTAGEDQGGSKNLRLAAVLLEAVYASGQLNEAATKMLKERWEGKDTSTPEFLGTDVRVMKWKPLKNGKDGILEFSMVPGLAVVEEEMVRVLSAVPGATELVGTESKGPQIRAMEEMIEGTWRKPAAKD